jgi:hypothetical protein
MTENQKTKEVAEKTVENKYLDSLKEISKLEAQAPDYGVGK